MKPEVNAELLIKCEEISTIQSQNVNVRITIFLLYFTFFIFFFSLFENYEINKKNLMNSEVNDNNYIFLCMVFY